MSSFDFSMYDYDDETPVSVPTRAEKPAQKEKVESSFDWNDYDYGEESPQEVPKERKNPFEVREVSPEEYKNMTAGEKISYAKELEKEQRYGFSKAFTKGAASGLTLGASENIPGFSTEETEGEPALASGAGQLVGGALPASKAFKLASYPVKAAFSKTPQMFQNFMKAFGAGSIFGAGEEAVKGVTGKEVEPTNIPLRGAEFAAFDAFIHGLGALGKRFLKISPKNQAEILEKGIIPEDLPKSQYETAEQILEELKSGQRLAEELPGGGPKPLPKSSERQISPERITPGKDIGLRPPTKPEIEAQSLQERVGDIITKERFYNSTQGGKAIQNEVMKIDEDVYRGVNELYAASRELNAGIEATHGDLINKIDNILAPLEKIPEPSTIQGRLIRAANRIKESLVDVNEKGQAVGLKTINNQTLIDQVQSLRQIIDFDFKHGDSKSIFRPLINSIQESVISAAEKSGNTAAAEANIQARTAYKAWTEAFDNDYIKPLRDTSNEDFSKIFKNSMELDHGNVLRKILNLSENGQRMANASTREMVEKNLSKFFDEPSKANPREFDKSLRELEAVITPKQASQIKEQFNRAVKEEIAPSRKFKAEKVPEKAASPEEEVASKYLKKSPEDIQSMMNSRTGIKTLRKDLSGSGEKKELFDKLSKQKMRSILREGNIEKDFTGDDLYRFLNKENNYELFSEFLGEESTEALRMTAKDIGKEQVKSEFRKNVIKNVAHRAAAYKSIALLLGLL